MVSAVLDDGIGMTTPQPGETYPLPYFFVGDNAYLLKTWLLKFDPNYFKSCKVFENILRGSKFLKKKFV